MLRRRDKQLSIKGALPDFTKALQPMQSLTGGGFSMSTVSFHSSFTGEDGKTHTESYEAHSAVDHGAGARQSRHRYANSNGEEKDAHERVLEIGVTGPL